MDSILFQPLKNNSIEERIAALLLSIGAVTLKPEDPYTWASGLRAPVYCDNRMIMGYPDVRETVTAGFVALLGAMETSIDLIAGTATAGIPHAAWLAHETRLPMVYVRSKPKGHGRQNQVEGPVRAGQSAVVIEDLVSTGGSSVAVVNVLREAGVDVRVVLAVFSYGFDEASAAFEAAGVPFKTLTNFETLIAVAEREGRLHPDELQTMRDWRRDPRAWSEKMEG